MVCQPIDISPNLKDPLRFGATSPGECLYRISYYTFRHDGRLYLRSQMSRVMNERELLSLLEHIADRSWF